MLDKIADDLLKPRLLGLAALETTDEMFPKAGLETLKFVVSAIETQDNLF